MKFALKFAYLGSEFYGSQRQSKKRTVQGELEKVLGPIKIASRTDTGVSALGAVCTFETNKKPNLNRINQLLPQDILALDLIQVDDDFKPRHSKMKHYKYYLPYMGQDLQKLKKKKFDTPTKTQLEKIVISKKGKFVVFDFWGPHFGYKAIRKIIGKILGTGIAPPWGLVLVDIQYTSLKFNNKVKPTFKSRFDKNLEKHLQLSQILKQLKGT